MGIITVRDLKKNYITYKRGSSFVETLKSLFVRKQIQVNALKGISFDVEEGEILGFLGPNGAGKSTTLKILTGVLYPTSGEVNIMGYVPWLQRKAYVANIGAVFGQKSQLIWDIPPVDSFEMNRAIYSIPKHLFNSRLERMTDILKVSDVITKPTRQLSLGERMKCEFIMAMLHEPKIVFLDEPTIGLDIFGKEKIRDFIKEMNSMGTTFILTTHDLDDVERLANRIIIINNGESVYDDSLDSMRKFFGLKKVVSVSTKGQLPDFTQLRGVTVKEKASPFKADLELDYSKMDLNGFIQYVNEKSTIIDLTIEEPPIESIIKELYQTDNLIANSPL